MFQIALGSDDFYENGQYVKIGSVASAIARILLANGARNKFQAERDAWPHIYTGIVAGKLHPLDKINLQLLSADNSGNGIVLLDELVEWGEWCKRFDFVRQTAAPAPEEWEVTLSATIEQVEGIKRNHGRYTLEEAAAFISERTGEDAKGLRNRFVAAVENGDLASYAPHSFVKRDGKVVRDFYDEVYWNDLNAWLEKNEPRLYQNCKFPDPAAPASKGDAAPDETQAKRDQRIAEDIKAMINEPPDVTEAKRAEEIKEQAAEIRNIERPEGRYTIPDAIILLLDGTGDYYRVGEAVESGDIPCYKHETGDKKGDPKYWLSYVCWDDLNKWIKEKTNIREFRFPDPAAPTAKVEKTKPGITKGAVINAFEELHFDSDKWDKYLGDPPNWLKECRVAMGSKRASATWNPVLIAAALFDRKISIKELDAVFVGLKDWADEWREISASFRD